jgi:hypothetical protein
MYVDRKEEVIILRPLLFMLLAMRLISLYPTQAEASSISCPGGIVSSGDSVVVLLNKCGQPDWKDSHQEEITGPLSGGLRQRTYVTVEQWTYNFGPQQLLRIVTIRNGTVAGIQTSGRYGFSKDEQPVKPECGDHIISHGESEAEVLAKCGDPFYRTSHAEEIWEPMGASGFRKVMVTVEEWTYNFGPQRLMRIITFRNGRVTNVRTDGYGVP